MLEKFKSVLADDAIFTALLLVLVGVISFGLGRQSVEVSSQTITSTQPAGVIFTESALNQVQTDLIAVDNSTETIDDKSTSQATKQTGKLVASKTRKKRI